MNVRLGRSDFDQLVRFISKDKAVVNKIIKSSRKESKEVLIFLDEPLCKQVGDLLTEELALVGFDKNYDLTEAGEKLEDFIDLFTYTH